ncbi:MAG TPA: hypothetical protein VGH89_23895 [Pseudonocardia sp.]|jgi:hypothetical protein
MVAKGFAKQVRHALDAVESAPGALETLAEVRRLREAAEELEIAAVSEVRAQGGTWTQIGAVYGTSKQAAQQRFRGAIAERAAGNK